ncbi:MAG: hypothetical protein ABI846_06505 [Rudaea sp.]
MSDPNTFSDGVRELNAQPVRLGDALRALPLATPPAAAWSDLAASLASAAPAQDARRRRPRRFALPVAVAAGVVFAFIATLSMRAPRLAEEATHASAGERATKPSAAASSVHNAANDTNDENVQGLDAMQSQSRALERWLRDTGRDSAPQTAQDLAASAEIEDMIGMVDVQLASPGAGHAPAALPLWQRRVALLEDLATLRYGASVNQLKPGLLASENGETRQATWNN